MTLFDSSYTSSASIPSKLFRILQQEVTFLTYLNEHTIQCFAGSLCLPPNPMTALRFRLLFMEDSRWRVSMRTIQKQLRVLALTIYSGLWRFPPSFSQPTHLLGHHFGRAASVAVVFSFPWYPVLSDVMVQGLPHLTSSSNHVHGPLMPNLHRIQGKRYGHYSVPDCTGF